MSALVVLFLLMDAGMKLAAIGPVLQAGEQLGFPGADMARKLGALLLVCTLLYVYPRTSLLGAILITGYLGGAVATHVRLDNPLFSHVLFGVYLGVLMWGGLVLREPRMRNLLLQGA
ncbi:MAG TPA: DoxX family protein [Steroidobacteraceae bacterium]|nr:DoxX family protein [Steroidobacteraceae bacterium]